MSTVTTKEASEKGCLSCHEGIESIRVEASEMLMQIQVMGALYGDPKGCVFCRGGKPKFAKKTLVEDASVLPQNSAPCEGEANLKRPLCLILAHQKWSFQLANDGRFGVVF